MERNPPLLTFPLFLALTNFAWELNPIHLHFNSINQENRGKAHVWISLTSIVLRILMHGLNFSNRKTRAGGIHPFSKRENSLGLGGKDEAQKKESYTFRRRIKMRWLDLLQKFWMKNSSPVNSIY